MRRTRADARGGARRPGAIRVATIRPRRIALRTIALRTIALATVGLAPLACHAPPPPPPAQGVAPPTRAEEPSLVPACRDLFAGAGEAPAARPRTVGELLRMLRRSMPGLALGVHPCKAGTAWPIAYATSEPPPRAPIGFGVLTMSGDALLTLDAKDRDAPTINLCSDLDLALDEAHRLRVVALWPSTDEGAFDPAHADRSTATIAWLELFSRAPSACARGAREGAGVPPERWLAERLACADVPYVVRDRGACDAPGAASVTGASAPEGSPSALDVERAGAALHRFGAEGRTRAPDVVPFTLERAERCYVEPPPARRDVCLAVYRDPSGARWYGRGEPTRTGEAGEKNYVDSYLTFRLLQRIEAERKASTRPAAAPASPSKIAPAPPPR